MSQIDERELKFAEELMGRQYYIHGVEVKPPLMSLFAVLKIAKCPIGTGLFDLEADRLEIEVLKFLKIASVETSIVEAYRLAKNADKLEEAALELGASMVYGDLDKTVEEIQNYVNAAFENKVKPMPKEGDEAKPVGE